MRFLGYVLQFASIVSALCILGNIVPSSVLSYFTWVAHVFLCINLATWIIYFIQDYFFVAEVDTKNKAVLITGCDTGFGNAIAQILDKKGYNVFACCLDKTCDGAAELKDRCSSRLKVIQMDVTDSESVDEAAKYVEENLHKSDFWAVINNAGVLKGFHTEFTTMKEYEMCLQVNALGMVRVTKAFLPLIRKSRGRIINICSMAGRIRSPYLGPYIMSKTAAVAFSEVLMQEMREFGIRVISIEPEFFKTPMCSEEHVTNVLSEAFSEVPVEIKSAFGSKYIDKAQSIYRSIFLNRSSNVELVYSAIESAVSLQNPADIYHPCRNIYIKTLFFLSERVPLIFCEQFVMIVNCAMGLPSPKSGINVLHRFIKM